MSNKYDIYYRFWITKNNEPFLGKGRVELLLKIKELGSLKKASEALKMSYRKAYYAIDHANKLCHKPLVVIKRGGKNGGSTELTPYGLEMITRFEKLAIEFDNFTKKLDL